MCEANIRTNFGNCFLAPFSSKSLGCVVCRVVSAKEGHVGQKSWWSIPPPCAVDPLNLPLWLHAGSEYLPGGAVHIFMTFNRPDLTAHGQHTECAIPTPMRCTYPNHTNTVAVEMMIVPAHGRPLFLGRGCKEGKPFLQHTDLDSCRIKRPCQLSYGRKEYH